MIALPGASASPPAQAPAPPAAQRGGQSEYTRELALRILDRIANGETLSAICDDPGMPAAPTVRAWAIEDRDGFAALSARAYAMGWEKVAEECFEIADNARNDWMEVNGKEDVGYRLNGEAVQRSRLRIDTRMRLLGKWAPKRYGEKLELGGSVELTLAQRLKQLDAERVPEHASMPPGADL